MCLSAIYQSVPANISSFISKADTNIQVCATFSFGLKVSFAAESNVELCKFSSPTKPQTLELDISILVKPQLLENTGVAVIYVSSAIPYFTIQPIDIILQASNFNVKGSPNLCARNQTSSTVSLPCGAFTLVDTTIQINFVVDTGVKSSLVVNTNIENTQKAATQNLLSLSVKALFYSGNNVALAASQSNLLPITAKLSCKLHGILMTDRWRTSLYHINILVHIKLKAKFVKLSPFFQLYAFLLSWHTSVLLKSTPFLMSSANPSKRNKLANIPRPVQVQNKINFNVDFSKQASAFFGFLGKINQETSPATNSNVKLPNFSKFHSSQMCANALLPFFTTCAAHTSPYYVVRLVNFYKSDNTKQLPPFSSFQVLFFSFFIVQLPLILVCMIEQLLNQKTVKKCQKTADRIIFFLILKEVEFLSSFFYHNLAIAGPSCLAAAYAILRPTYT